MAAAAGSLLVVAAACGEPSTAVPDDPQPRGALVAELRCRADARAATVECENASTGGGASRDVMIVGGQHHYVRLASSDTEYDPQTDALSTTVTVQNLLVRAMGTSDGAVPDADGVRVFFHAGPTGGATVANAAGTGTFTAANQPYFQYSGAELGGDGILSPGETSAGKTWRFALNGAGTFTFSVYVWAQVPAGAFLHLSQVGGGEGRSCGLDADGNAYCWGGGGYPVYPRVPTAVAMPGVTFTQLSVGAWHSCAVGTNGKAYCWGSDLYGQLGDSPDKADRLVPTPVAMPAGVTVTAISAGTWHTCALASNGIAYCWGDDTNGTLGDEFEGGETPARTLPIEVPQPGAGVSFTQITTGFRHTCALATNDRAYCWGDDTYGQLGNGIALTQPQPDPTAVVMPEGVAFTAISAGNGFTCAIGSDGNTYCWGSDALGQLGNGAAVTANQPVPVAAQLPAGVTFTRISAGFQHACALTAGGAAWCWGSDDNGRLGNGAVTGGQPAPTEVVLPPGITFTGITAAMGSDFSGHTCAVTAGAAYCWGANQRSTFGGGQLGDGSTADRDVPTVVAATR